ncbi:hypothetical protein PG989_010305 [Apiospora arundinis]
MSTSGTPPRRLSTGGQPPTRIFEHYVVEQVPSRDDRTPCFTAWLREEIADGCRTTWNDEPIRVADTRPKFSIQVYETTPLPPSSQGNGSCNGVEQHLKALAQALHAETREERDGPPGGDRDRIDVWSLPLPADLSDEEKLATCKAHLLAEIAARDAGDITGFPIERVHDYHKWGRALYIIDRPPALWNEGEGGILELLWDVNPGYRAMLVREGGEQYETLEFEPGVARVTRAMLGDQWLKMRHGATRY